ncbi:MAG: hypothetical protein OQL19_17175 [Gammaproteobacteria bacterium]|nr:hypothetical protein [Gammaproteobacteria bacterium]
MLNQIKKNSLSLISLVVALSALSYNTWRNEQSEYNRNIRYAGFEVLLHVGEIQRIVYLAHYDKDTLRGNPRSGWVEILVIKDLTQLMTEDVIKASDELYDSWSEHWNLLGTDSDIGVADIDHKINQLRMKILESLKILE